MRDLLTNTKSFFFKSKRVWYVLKKPTREEFEQVTKISAIGILIVGVLGFAISILINLFI